jgi:hypothetical protein
MTEQHRQEQRTQEAIKVRQVTEVHGNFNEEERGDPGKFSLQFVLDNGAEELRAQAHRRRRQDSDAHDRRGREHVLRYGASGPDLARPGLKVKVGASSKAPALPLSPSFTQGRGRFGAPA